MTVSEPSEVIQPSIPDCGQSNEQSAPGVSERTYQRLLYKYAHVGCPAAHYEDNCDRPSDCAWNGRCLDLAPLNSASEDRS